MLSPLLHRLAELGLDPVGALLLAGDCLVLVAFAVVVLDWLEVDPARPLHAFLAFGLLLLATIVCSANVFGWTGLLAWQSMIASHVLLAGGALVLHRRPWRAARFAARTATGLTAPFARLLTLDAWRWPRAAASAILLAILSLLVLDAGLALFGFPVNWDSNVYRLTRIAYWLQEGAIVAAGSDEALIDFMPRNADLVMLWLTSFFRLNFPLVSLAQWFAGTLAVAALYEICRTIGFAPVWRLAAVLLFLGTPNAAVQFPTSQTDLFTTGCLTAGLYFLLLALRHGRAFDWCWGGLGIGLAIGAKPTVLYWGPGLAVLFLGWFAAERSHWRPALRGIVLALPIAAFLAAPPYVEAALRFGGDLAPETTYAKIHKTAVGSRLNYAAMNSLAYLWQVFEPDSNPAMLQPLLEPPRRAIASLLLTRPEHYEMFHASFRQMSAWIGYGPHEDYASFGISLLLAALAGGAAAVCGAVRRRADAWIPAAAFASVAVFFVSFCVFQSWTLHKFRYFVLLAPWLAVLAVYGLRALPRRAGIAAAALLLACHLWLGLRVAVDGRDHGLRTVIDPRRSSSYVALKRDHELVEKLGTRPRRVALAFRHNTTTASLMRAPVEHRFELESLQELDGYPALDVYLREKESECLLTDPKGVLAAKRGVRVELAEGPGVPARMLACLAPEGEEPLPRIFAVSGWYGDGWTELETTLRIEGGDGAPASAELWNRTALERSVAIHGAGIDQRWTLAPMEKRTIELAAAGGDASVTLTVDPPFVPAEVDPRSPDTRALGVQMRLFTQSEASR